MNFLILSFCALLSGFIQDPKEVPHFRLRNIDNRVVSTADYPEARGFIVIFTCNHCPFAKLYGSRLNDLNSRYSALGVPLFAVNPMDTVMYEEESFEGMQAYARQYQLNFPYLYDSEQIVGKAFNAQHTPMAYVIWKEGDRLKIRYQGAIDDNGEHPELAHSLIAPALDELLAGRPVSKPVTESFGCRIFYRKD